MKKARETMDRQYKMFHLLPRYPRGITVKELHETLAAEGYEVSRRTIERDLKASLLPISNEQDDMSGSQKWFWTDSDKIFDLPQMSPETALTLLMARDHLQPLLPGSLLKLLTPYTNRAAEVLSATKLKSWSKKVRVIDGALELKAPAVSPTVRDVVFEALRDDLQFEATYKGRNHDEPREYVINPLGLTVVQGVNYLICTLWNYDDPLHLALHRMSKPALTKQKARRPANFNLSAYLDDQKPFRYLCSDKTLKLKLRFYGDAGEHLYERELAPNQTIKRLPDSSLEVRAEIGDTSALRWWLQGFGDLVEVIQPASLRKEFAETAQKLQQLYSQ